MTRILALELSVHVVALFSFVMYDSRLFLQSNIFLYKRVAMECAVFPSSCDERHAYTCERREAILAFSAVTIQAGAKPIKRLSSSCLRLSNRSISSNTAAALATMLECSPALAVAGCIALARFCDANTACACSNKRLKLCMLGWSCRNERSASDDSSDRSSVVARRASAEAVWTEPVSCVREESSSSRSGVAWTTTWVGESETSRVSVSSRSE